MDVVDPSPKYNCQFQIRIWLRDMDAYNWLYLLILSTRTTQGLNRSRTPAWRFWKRPRVAHLFGARKSRGLISRRSETDHFGCLLCSLLFRGGQELSLEGLYVPGDSDREEQIEKGILNMDSGYLLHLQVLSCSGVRCSTGWQALNVRHIRRNIGQINCHFLRSRGVRGRCGISNAVVSIWTIATRACRWSSGSSFLWGLES